MKYITLLLLLGMAWSFRPVQKIELGPCAPPGSATSCSPNYAETVARLQSIAAKSEGRIILLPAGTSVQNRTIWYAKAGTGPAKYMAWGRQHGDECVGTAAILKVLERLSSKNGNIRKMLERATFILVPIFNVDGSELHTRNNAAGVNLNRDWCMQGQDSLPQQCTSMGQPVPACSCQSDASQFTQPETNAIWNTFILWKPNMTMDIHQSAAALHPETGEYIAGQPVVVRSEIVLPAHDWIIFRSQQGAQLFYESIRETGNAAARWENNPAAAGLPERASGRIAQNGKRNINDSEAAGTQWPAATFGPEMRRVCPKYERNLEEVTYRMLWDQLEGTANGHLFDVNPLGAFFEPFGLDFTCTTPCPAATDADRINEAWYHDWEQYQPEESIEATV